jgi:hypothetical protein
VSRPRRNDPCHCGSGKKYKRCCLDGDVVRDRIERLTREIPPADPALMAEVMPILQAKMAKEQETARRLRDDYGVHVNYVRPVQWQGGKVWAIGSRVYPARPANDTFHEFILHVLRETFGEPWHAEQVALAADQRHFIARCFAELAEFKKANIDPDQLERDGVVSAEPNGWVSYLMSLAWDVATLIHASELPDALVQRLLRADQFQGARYEVAIAAIFARLDCEIRWLDEEEALRGVMHVEFEATHRPTGQVFAVEAKSRRRSGVINEPGKPDTDALRGDARAVRRLFVNAAKKPPDGLPFFVFIDVNAPFTADIETRWQGEVQRWISRLPVPTADTPDVYNSLYVTNFSPHYDGDDISRGGSWLEVSPLFVREPLTADIYPPLRSALNAYGRIPPFTEDGLMALPASSS